MLRVLVAALAALVPLCASGAARAEAPPTISLTAEATRISAGHENGYTVTLRNGNDAPYVVDAIRDRFPDHGAATPEASARRLAFATEVDSTPFDYVAGTSTVNGVAVADPSWVTTYDLVWNGPFVVPAHGELVLRFRVLMPPMAATYPNSAAALAGRVEVASLTRVAPVVVTSDGPIVVRVIPDLGTSRPADVNGYTINLTNTRTSAFTFRSLRNGLPGGFRYVSGSTSGLTTEEPGISTSGQFLTWGSYSIGAGETVKLHFNVTVARSGSRWDRVRVVYFQRTDGYKNANTGPVGRIRVANKP